MWEREINKREREKKDIKREEKRMGK